MKYIKRIIPIKPLGRMGDRLSKKIGRRINAIEKIPMMKNNFLNVKRII